MWYIYLPQSVTGENKYTPQLTSHPRDAVYSPNLPGYG